MVNWKKREDGVWNLYFDTYFDKSVCTVVKLPEENEYCIKSRQCNFNETIISGTVAGAKADAMLLVAAFFRERAKYYTDMNNDFSESVRKISTVCSEED